MSHNYLMLFFIFIFKKRIFPTLIAIASAYLCCQISNWTTIFVSSFINETADIIQRLYLEYALTTYPGTNARKISVGSAGKA